MKVWRTWGGMTGFSVAGCAVAVAVLLAACDGGGGGDGPSGKSTVQGTVESFSGGSATYLPPGPESKVTQWARAIAALFVPDAEAAVGGVTVRVAGTDLSGTTDDRGFFIVSGVPGGNRQLEFTYNGQTAPLDVAVPDDGTVTLDRVRINNGSASVARVNTVENPGSGDDNANANANANANSNSGGGATSNDNNQNRNGNSNTNANDNDDDDDNGNVNGNTNANANDNDDDDDDDNGNDNDDNGNDNDDDDDDDNGNDNR